MREIQELHYCLFIKHWKRERNGELAVHSGKWLCIVLFNGDLTTLTRLIKLQYKRITNMAGFVTSYMWMASLFNATTVPYQSLCTYVVDRLLPSRKIKYIKIMNTSGGFVLSKLHTFIWPFWSTLIFALQMVVSS